MSGEFSGPVFNQNVDVSYLEYMEMRDKVVKWMTEDGPPPSYADRSPISRLEYLRGRKLAQSSEYWNNPAAQRELTALELRFGQ